MDNQGRFDFFRYEDCTLCGDCLARCEYIDFSRDEAVEEVKGLIDGRPSRKLQKGCISCYACNAFCPQDCRPYELITRNWFERYKHKGLPVRASYLMPSSFPNFRTDVVKNMSAREQEMLRRWSNTPPEGELVLYPGCNLMTLPHLVDAGFMQGVTISGDWDLCCGEMFFRMGLFDAVERTARKLTEHYRGREIGKMLFTCPACLNMFRNVLPDQFGAEFSFETEYLGSYLLARMQESGQPARRLERKVTVHDSCHARILGDEVLKTSRDLFTWMGLEIKEMDHSGLQGYCCGAAAGCNRYSPFDIIFSAMRELWEAQKTGARDLALYCTGCQITLSLCSWLFPTLQPVRHMLEYLREATGEEVSHPAQGRTFHMLTNITYKALPKMLSPRHYRV
jgi:Fe-S oxidoreductase